MGTPRGRLFVLVAATLLACSSSYVTQDGGAGAGTVDAGVDGEPGGTGDSGDDGDTCGPVTVKPVPPHGGPACPTDASACFPGDVTGFSPTWIPPVSGAPHANVCTAQQISDALADCFGSTESSAACGGWRNAASANQPCYECLSTDASAPRYGALLNSGAYSQVNFAGCIALAEPCNQPCASAILAVYECNLDACNPSSGPCTVTDQASLTREDACLSAADATCGCAGFDTATQCFAELQQEPAKHPAVELCDVGTSSFDAGYTAVATFMCGPP
jgi:hypothetical protein